MSKLSNPMTIMSNLDRIVAAHESFLESYPDDINSEEGRRYCINNILRETASLMTDLSHRLVVDKDIDTQTVEDIYLFVTLEMLPIMDKYNGRDENFYLNEVSKMIIERR